MATRLEVVNQRLRALSAKNAVELGTEAISQDATALKVIRTEDMDPNSMESEEPLPAGPDPWPGDDKRAGEVRGHGNAALFAQLHGICVEHGPVEEVLWAEAEREEVREEGRQRRQVYAERMVAQTSRNLGKTGPIRAGDLVMLRDTAVAKEKGLKFYYWWTGSYLVRSVTQGGMSFVLQHPMKIRLCMEPTIVMTSGFGQCVLNTYGILPAPPYNRGSQRIYVSIEKDWSRTWPGSSTKSNLECKEMLVRGEEDKEAET